MRECSGASTRKSGWCEGSHQRCQRSLPGAIDAGILHAFFYKFLEHFCFGIQYLQIPPLKNTDSLQFFGPIIIMIMIMIMIMMVPSHILGLYR